MRYFLIAAMLMLSTGTSADEVGDAAAAARAIKTLFPDYVIMNEDELDAGMVKYLRQGNSHDYGPLTRITADFDGNGLDDHAAFLRPREGSGGGFVIVLQTGEGRFRTVHKTLSGRRVSGHEFITRIEAGREVSPFDAIDGLTEVTVLRHPAIAYVIFEKASEVIYWNAETEKFEEIWVTD